MSAMIPYEELDKALARWKARTQNAVTDAAREFEASGAVPATTSSGVSGGMPTSGPERTGEIDVGDAESLVESYEEA